MFQRGYLLQELRRRWGRTLVTALGLAVGVGLVLGIIGLSQGLSEAQTAVLQPLSSIGTDILVTRVATSTATSNGAPNNSAANNGGGGGLAAAAARAPRTDAERAAVQTCLQNSGVRIGERGGTTATVTPKVGGGPAPAPSGAPDNGLRFGRGGGAFQACLPARFQQ